MPAPSPDLPGSQPLAGQLVVFTGKLSSLGRREARALVARLGGATADDVTAKTTILVVGAEGFGPAAADRNADKSQKLKRAEDLKIRVLSEEDFCRLAGVPTPTALKRQYHAMRDLMARYRALRDDQLRYLVKCGILRPALRTNSDTYFAFPELSIVKQANEGLEQGIAFRTIVRALIVHRRRLMRVHRLLDDVCN